jgi:hypothetical protein
VKRKWTIFPMFQNPGSDLLVLGGWEMEKGIDVMKVGNITSLGTHEQNKGICSSPVWLATPNEHRWWTKVIHKAHWKAQIPRDVPKNAGDSLPGLSKNLKSSRHSKKHRWRVKGGSQGSLNSSDSSRRFKKHRWWFTRLVEKLEVSETLQKTRVMDEGRRGRRGLPGQDASNEHKANVEKKCSCCRELFPIVNNSTCHPYRHPATSVPPTQHTELRH